MSSKKTAENVSQDLLNFAPRMHFIDIFFLIFLFLMSLFSSHQHHSIYVKLENFVLYEFSFHSIFFILISFLLKTICVSMNFHCFHLAHIYNEGETLLFDTWYGRKYEMKRTKKKKIKK